jgi:hypothetical protein
LALTLLTHFERYNYVIGKYRIWANKGVYMSVVSSSAAKLKKMIDEAIADEVITPKEYEQILMLADEDGIIDAQEKALLAQLQEMIQSGAVKRASSSAP